MAEKLSQRVIADAALAAIDANGVDALSMRRLAQDLGTSAMSLYTYFADKDALLDAVAQLLLAEVDTPPEDVHWRDAMRFIMRSVRHVAMRHPNAARLIHNGMDARTACRACLAEPLSDDAQTVAALMDLVDVHFG